MLLQLRADAEWLPVRSAFVAPQDLPHLRARLRASEAAYREALCQYFAAYGDLRDITVLHGHVSDCRACGAALDAALGALIDALWLHVDDDACAAEQRRMQGRRALLAQEQRLLEPA
jgi:hypothetical protein